MISDATRLPCKHTSPCVCYSSYRATVFRQVSEESDMKVIGCMYSRGFPDTIQHVQSTLQTNEARAVTCVMAPDEGDGAGQKNWMFYRLTEAGLEFWSNVVPDHDDRQKDQNAEPLFREVEVTLECPLLEQTDSQVYISRHIADCADAVKSILIQISSLKPSVVGFCFDPYDSACA